MKFDKKIINNVTEKIVSMAKDKDITEKIASITKGKDVTEKIVSIAKGKDITENIASIAKDMDLDQEKLIEIARKKFKDACIKNNKHPFTKKDEDLFLQSLEDYNNDHFYVKSTYLNREAQIITNKVTQAIWDIYNEKVTIKVIITCNPKMKNNAYALPNGTVLIDISLLKSIEYLEELYFIIAHETAHIYRQHTIIFNNLESLSQKMLSGFLSKIRIKNNIIKFIADNAITIALNFLKSKHLFTAIQKSDEHDADMIASKILYSLNMSPLAGCNLLKRVDPENYISETHPKTSDRISRITELEAKINPDLIKLPTHTKMPQYHKDEVINAINHIHNKQKTIKIVSRTAGGIASAITLIILYFLYTIPLSENGFINSLQFILLGFLLNAIIYLTPILVPALFYYIYQKTYRKLK